MPPTGRTDGVNPAEGELLRDVQACVYARSDADLLAALPTLPHAVPDPVALVRAVLLRDHRPLASGVYMDQHFVHPFLRDDYPEEVLHFHVPEGYRPDTPFPLAIFLHGGGDGTSRAYSATCLQPDSHVRQFLAWAGVIGVAPSNLLLSTHQRWSTVESDRYLSAVIEEAGYRFRIDPDRVILLGQSMGAMGSYHVVQTMGDRFAAVGAHAGAWNFGFWEGLRGTWFGIMHGAQDQVAGARPKFTDIFYARLAHALLSGYHVPHVYREEAGGHTLNSGPALESARAFFSDALQRRRAACPPYIVTASAKGSHGLVPTPHWFWVSVDCVGLGSICYDGARLIGPNFNDGDFRYASHEAQGQGVVRADNCGENLFAVTTENVEAFTLWLSAGMVDFARPVRVEVNGHSVAERRMTPNLPDTLRSWRRHRDPGLLYPARLPVTLTPEQQRPVEKPSGPQPSVWETIKDYEELPDGRWRRVVGRVEGM